MAMNSRKGDPDQGLHIPPERPGIELHLLVENAVNAPPKRLPPRTPSTIGGFESSRQESTHLGAQSSSPSAAPQTVPQEKLGFLVAIVYISIALGALALAACLASLQNEEQSAFGDRLTNAARIITSLWPVVFAGAAGEFSKTVARWWTEKGAKLVHIEHLMASQNTLGAVFGPILLRFLHLQSIAMVIFWSFSPLGSQGLLRSVDRRSNFAFGVHPNPIRMVNPNFYADMVEANYSTIPHVPYKEQIASFVGACLTSIEAGIQNMHGLLPDYDQRKQKLGADLQRYGSDAWGNVRIPKLELLPSYDMERPNEWVNVLYNDELVNYASLIGLTVDDVPQDTVGNISWEMGAAYHNFKCQDWVVVDKDYYADRSTEDVPFLRDNFHSMYFSYNAPLASNTSEAGWSDVLDRMFRNGHLALDVETLDFNTSWRVYDDIYDINPPERPHDWPWRNGSYDFPERHIFVGIQSLVHHYALTKCKVSLSYVDVNVTFEQTSKGNTAYVVNRIRQQSSPPTSIKLHAFQHPTIAWQVKESFLDTLVPWDDNRSWPPFVMQYILDPAHFKSYNYPYRNDNFSGFMAENLTISMFEQRFGLVFNTFWRAFAQTSAVTDLDREEDPSYDDPEFQRAQMHVQYLSPRPLTYKLGLPWIVLYFIASFVMLVAAITTLVLKFTHKGPDLLGYVGSLFRASSYYDITAVSTAIGGFKATRQLAGIEIRVGDVEGRNEVGRIGLAGKEKADLLYRKNRVYQ